MISPNSLKNQKKTKRTSRNREVRQAMERYKKENLQSKVTPKAIYKYKN